MKVLSVNCVYKKGSTGKIVDEIHTGLITKDMMSVICYGRGSAVTEPFVYKTSSELLAKVNNLLSRFTGLMYGGCFFSTKRLISIVRKEKPDVVHVHCINGYFVNIYKFISWLKKNEIRTVVTLHAEFMHTANCGHALLCEKWKTGCGSCPRLRKETKSLFFDQTALSHRLMKEAFRDFNRLRVVSVSPWLKERAQMSPILAGKHHECILNGVNTEVFQYHPHYGELRKKFCAEGEKLVFHATASFSDTKGHLKGGYWLIQLAKMLKHANVRFLVAGRYQISEPVPENVTLLGEITDQAALAKLYSVADATLLVSQRETFSMILAESLCCGTPVVGFRAGGPESIAIHEFCRFSDYGDLGGLHRDLLDTLECLTDKRTVSEEACAKYASCKMVEQYYQIYQSMVSDI